MFRTLGLFTTKYFYIITWLRHMFQYQKERKNLRGRTHSVCHTPIQHQFTHFEIFHYTRSTSDFPQGWLMPFSFCIHNLVLTSSYFHPFSYLATQTVIECSYHFCLEIYWLTRILELEHKRVCFSAFKLVHVFVPSCI